MLNTELTPGHHNITMDLTNYITLEATINVSDTGIVTCVGVPNGSCNSTSAPGLTINNTAITGYLKGSLMDICTWISSKGGATGLITYDIMQLIRGYTNQENLGFNVTSAYIMGAVAYYSGNVPSGNQLTGCNF